MSSINSISAEKLARLIGTPKCPVLIDVRNEDDFAADPRLVPGSNRRAHADASDWAVDFVGRSAVVICQRGQKLSEGSAAWLRHSGAFEADAAAALGRNAQKSEADRFAANVLPIVTAIRASGVGTLTGLADAPRGGEGGSQLWPAIERVRALAALCLDELGRDLEALSLCKAGDSLALGVDPEAGLPLSLGGDAVVGDSRLHDQTAYHRLPFGGRRTCG